MPEYQFTSSITTQDTKRFREMARFKMVSGERAIGTAKDLIAEGYIVQIDRKQRGFILGVEEFEVIVYEEVQE